MTPLFAFVEGAVIGFFVGAGALAALSLASDADDEMDSFIEGKEKTP